MASDHQTKVFVSPYGGEPALLDRLHVAELTRIYKKKCGIDISSSFGDTQFAELYQCGTTGYKFWLPSTIAGNEEFYTKLSAAWPNYYRTTRWEYDYAQRMVVQNDTCLEVGCGQGYFLKSIEDSCLTATGLEFNARAIIDKVCRSEIIREDIFTFSTATACGYDKIFSFQVLEHVTNPMNFLLTCKAMLKPKGKLVISVPNDDNMVHQLMQDAFNMPPHHMGGYSEATFKNIANLLQMNLIEARSEPATMPSIQVTNVTKSRLAWRLFGHLVNRAGRWLLRSLSEPGHTLYVVLEKPTN